MRPKRFSIAGLMGFVLIMALGFGALKGASPLWASTYFTVVVAALIWAVLCAVQSRSRRRAFWLGFSVAGWVYFGLIFVFPSQVSYTANLYGFSAPPLLVSTLLQKLEPLFLPVPAAVTPIPVPVPPSASSSPFESMPTPNIGSSPANSSSMAGMSVNSDAAITYSFMMNPAFSPVAPPVVTVEQFSFHQVGQSLATLLIAFGGGFASLFLSARRERSEEDGSASP